MQRLLDRVWYRHHATVGRTALIRMRNRRRRMRPFVKRIGGVRRRRLTTRLEFRQALTRAPPPCRGAVVTVPVWGPRVKEMNRRLTLEDRSQHQTRLRLQRDDAFVLRHRRQYKHQYLRRGVA